MFETVPSYVYETLKEYNRKHSAEPRDRASERDVSAIDEATGLAGRCKV